MLPDRVGTPPAPQGGALRWAPGPSFDEALESAKGPEKAAADLLPLDATFDPETHEGAGEFCKHDHQLQTISDLLDSTL